jgi:hypothetical protein
MTDTTLRHRIPPKVLQLQLYFHQPLRPIFQEFTSFRDDRILPQKILHLFRLLQQNLEKTLLKFVHKRLIELVLDRQGDIVNDSLFFVTLANDSKIRAT